MLYYFLFLSLLCLLFVIMIIINNTDFKLLEFIVRLLEIEKEK